MIEMKYDEEKNNLKLPKNIRQVGKPGEKIKIYVEDYVITYINQIARESADQQRLAVLLGRLGKNKEDTVAFIDGAVEAKNVVVQEDQVVFTSEIWTQIYDEIGQYFHNTEIVGWFLTRPGKSLGINDQITKIHVDNFPGVDKALFIVDPLDNDEAFYIYDQGNLVRQDGYYIYYDRNEDMQNYMVDHKSGESSETAESNAFLKKREEVLERRQTQKTKENGRFAWLSKKRSASGDPADPSGDGKARKAGAGTAAFAKKDSGEKEKETSVFRELLPGLRRAGSVAATFVVLFALIFGFTQLNRNQATETSTTSQGETVPVDVASGNIETQAASGDDLAQADGGQDNDAAQAEGTQNEVIAQADGQTDAVDQAGAEASDSAQADVSQSEVSQDDIAVSADDADAVSDDMEADEYAQSDATGQTVYSSGSQTAESDVPVQNVIRQYEVQAGDTLAAITQRFYDDYKYIEIIQEMNQIEDPDKIYPGMTLNLP